MNLMNRQSDKNNFVMVNTTPPKTSAEMQLTRDRLNKILKFLDCVLGIHEKSSLYVKIIRDVISLLQFQCFTHTQRNIFFFQIR